MRVELAEGVAELPTRLLLRQESHALEVDGQTEAKHGLHKDTDCLKHGK